MVKKLVLLLAVVLCGISPATVTVLHGEDKSPKTSGPFEAELDKPKSKYWIYVPEDYTPYRSWPMMVVFHGTNGTAQQFITLFMSEARKNKYILVAVKSSGAAWKEFDEEMVMNTIKEVSKNYKVDPDRMFLAGFSAGGFMTSFVGFKHNTMFRGLGLMSPIPFAPGVGKSMALMVVCGDMDTNYPKCKSAYEMLKAQKCDTEMHTMAGVGHKLDDKAIPWVFTKFAERLNNPDNLLKRGKKAAEENRYLDALDCFNRIISILEDGKDEKKEDKIQKEAEAELKKLDKIASDKYKQALKKIEAKKTEDAVKLLEEIVNQFEGTSAWNDAKEKLNELKKPDEKPAGNAPEENNEK
jgi:hypothetical protein